MNGAVLVFSNEEVLNWMETSGTFFDADAAMLKISDNERNKGTADLKSSEERSTDRACDESEALVDAKKASRSLDTKKSRLMDSKLAKRRKMEEANSAKFARAVDSITDLQRRPLEEIKCCKTLS
eukprot:IDg7609t1